MVLDRWQTIAQTNEDSIQLQVVAPGPCLNIKTILSKYGDSHVKDKTVARPSYL